MILSLPDESAKSYATNKASFKMNQTSLDQYFEILRLVYLVFITADPAARYSHKLELSKLIAKL